MSKIWDLDLKWISWRKYTFEVYNYDVNFKEVPWIYIISKRNTDKTHSILYIWETENMKERHQSHHKEDCFSKNANCKCFLIEKSSQIRLNIESDLIKNYTPNCNW